MYYSIIIIIFLLLFLRIIDATFEHNDDNEEQIAAGASLPYSQRIHRLSSSVLGSLSHSNGSSSLSSLSFASPTLNLDGLGLSTIESDTFVNYPIPVSTIILSGNVLSYLPGNLFEPFSTSLIHLDLQRNRFHSLTNNYFLRCLRYLRTLDLSMNQLDELSTRDFIGLRRLETLILRENQLNYLSGLVFSRCRTVTTLDLSDNRLSTIDSNVFRTLYKLKVLLLSNNPLGQRSLIPKLFQPLTKLEFLDLENTELDDLPAYLFVSNTRLRSIKLRRNRFHSRDSSPRLRRTFCGTRSLIEIDLVSTHLRSLDVCTFDQIPSLHRLYLMNNPLHCTCDLFYLKYGDIFRLLLGDSDRIHANIDAKLDQWITRPELRRHLEMAQARGDLHRLPIDLSLFTRCAEPKQWHGREIANISGVFGQCQERWLSIKDECQGYCEWRMSPSVMSISSGSTLSISVIIIAFVVYL